MTEYVSRDEAKAKGLGKYFTGQSCRNGHASPRSTSTGKCLACEKRRQQSYYQKDVAGHREKTRQWRASNLEAVKASNRERHLRRKFGITSKTFEAMRQQQDDCCWICQNPFVETPSVDHCHTTGRIRGLLCTKCNTGIGLLEDSPELLLRAVEYLRRGSS